MAIDKSFSWVAKDVSKLDLKSLQVAVVGGTGGLGRAISRVLADRGANVIVVGQTFRDSDVKGIEFVKADLSSIAESQKIAESLPAAKLDLVVFTTGIFAAPKRQETAELLEKDMAVSYLNRLAMVRKIAPKLNTQVNELGFSPRVFIMGFPGNGELGTIDNLNQEDGYATMKAHMNTVAGNEALVVESKDRFPNTKFFGLNPGIIKTNIRGNLLGENSWKQRVLESLIGWFSQTPETYAKKIVPLLVAPELEKYNGGFFDNSATAILGTTGFSKEYAKKFVTASEELLASKGLNV